MKILPFLFFLLLSSAALAAGIGVSPSEIEFKDVLPGGYAERLVTVSNPDDRSMTYGISVEGEIADWTYFDSTTFEVDALSPAQVLFIISPPDDVATGTYHGTVTIVALESSYPEEGHGMGIKAGARIPVTLTVTGQENIDYEILSISSGTGGGGGGGKSKFKFQVSLINKGNVKITPHVHVDVWDRDQTRIVKSVDLEGEDLLPTKEGTQEYEILTANLKPGQYWADITVTINGKVVKKQLLTFDVYKKEELPKGEIVDVFHKVHFYLDEVARIDFVFENKGSKTTSAIFRGSVFFNEQEVDQVESEEVTASPGEKVNLTVFFKPEDLGQYIIKGRAYYSDKVTYPVDTVLNVVSGSPTDITGAFTGMFAGISSPLTIVVIGLVLYILYRLFTKPKDVSSDFINSKKATYSKSAGKPKTKKSRKRLYQLKKERARKKS